MIDRRTFALSSLALLGIGIPGRAQSGALKLGTATPGGSFPLYAAAFVDLVKIIDPTLSIREVSTRGPSDNLRQLERGELDLGLVTGEVLHEALEGIGRPQTEAKAVVAAFPMPGMFAVLPESRYRTVGDLKGRPIVWNPRTSGPATQGRYVMDGLGLDTERDFEPVYTETVANGPPLVIERQAAAIWGGGLRWPGFVTIAESPRGARFIAPNAEEIEQIRAKHPFFRPLTVPAGLYRGQRDPIETVGTWSVLMARPDLPDAVGRRLAAALGKAEKGQLLPRQLAQSTARNTVAALPEHGVLQPGVRAHFEEQGLI
ncbi:TAXI family TRAP transporter solute-binding subunit [Reyranella sp.]|uniref:TAXI family TRAP transporter solute-binding subunit n=1 Tax=Reyranella sp. TaxID=1929291 RepID=UPI003BACF92F